MSSWVFIPPHCDFSLQNLPYGVFSVHSDEKRIGTAIGDYVLDLKALSREGLFSSIEFDSSTLQNETLNEYANLGKEVHKQIRVFLQELLSKETSIGSELRDNHERRARVLIPLTDVEMHLPMTIGDYTDFFVGIHHAENCTNIRRPGHSLPINYTHLPIGYHGRSSSVVASGTPFSRPKGQSFNKDRVISGPSRKLDYEVEFAAFIGQGNDFGHPINIENAADHIFGVVLLNDWSARDIQFWESTPLGPFNGKNFCTTISPWIVALEALDPFRTKPLAVKSETLDYLVETDQNSVYDIFIEIQITANEKQYLLGRTNTRHVIFSFPQMITHHTYGGCPLRTGDLLATGTLSGPTLSEAGSLLEASLDGTKAVEASLKDQSDDSIVRNYLEDGDEICFSARAEHPAWGPVGFGPCLGKILPAVP